MLERSKQQFSEEEKRELDLCFLEAVQEGLAFDVAAVERGSVPRKWEGDAPLPPDALEQLRRYHQQIGKAIAHVRSGGALEEGAEIFWGRRQVEP